MFQGLVRLASRSSTGLSLKASAQHTALGRASCPSHMPIFSSPRFVELAHSPECLSGDSPRAWWLAGLVPDVILATVQGGAVLKESTRRGHLWLVGVLAAMFLRADQPAVTAVSISELTSV